MKAFFKELLEYTHYYNIAVIDVMLVNEGKTSEKIIQLMSHIINAHQIWNARLKSGKEPLFGIWVTHSISHLHELENQNFHRSLSILDKNELSDLINWQTTKGQPFTTSVQDMLFQVINHATYHRAQIATEFRINGVNPLLTDFIHYKMTGH
jgi:uncharacterized damage-inducible protein DinB